jgi:hypothetical protein
MLRRLALSALISLVGKVEKEVVVVESGRESGREREREREKERERERERSQEP